MSWDLVLGFGLPFKKEKERKKERKKEKRKRKEEQRNKEIEKKTEFVRGQENSGWLLVFCPQRTAATYWS